jgi:hypothetical protein
MNIGRELLNVPLPEMVKSLGVGIAEAQFALDRASIKIAQLMSGFTIDDKGKLVKDESALVVLKEGTPGVSLLSLGFTPTFYQFVETSIEVSMAISMSEEKSFSVGASFGVSYLGMVSASVNASYSQKFQYEASGSSRLSTKLVTVPAPVTFENRLKEISEQNNG